MWLFCEAGFFSVVRKGGGPDDLVVRARCREDLEHLRQWCPSLGEIKATPSSDYAFRAMVKRDAWAGAIAAMSEDIEYSNFKDHIGRISNDHARLSAYNTVWSAMAKWQKGCRT